jgi:hypothetical protein
MKSLNSFSSFCFSSIKTEKEVITSSFISFSFFEKIRIENHEIRFRFRIKSWRSENVIKFFQKLVKLF